MSFRIKKYPFWKKWLAAIIYYGLKLYTSTYKTTIHGLEEVQQTLRTQKTGVIFLLWHNSILLLPALTKLLSYTHPRILISYSSDGDIPSLVAEHFPNVAVIRVRHNARQTALKTTIDLLHSNYSLFITPDGPRGPKYTIKEGALFAAKTSNTPIIPIIWSVKRKKQLCSWDQFIIPYPFSPVSITFLPALYPETLFEEEFPAKVIAEKMQPVKQ